MEKKKCSKSTCLQLNPQPLSNFTKRASRKSGFSSICKACAYAANKLWRKNNPEKLAKKQRRASLSRLYFPMLTPLQAEKEWERIFKEQNGLCKICYLTIATDVDHCHKTGKVRGLLCNPCNLLLGKIEKRPWFISNMTQYLEKAHK